MSIKEKKKNKLISDLMNWGGKPNRNDQYHEMLFRLSESENPKYTKYKDQYLTCTSGSFCKSELDNKDMKMIKSILINETKYSDSLITNLEKLLQVKNQILKYNKEKDVLEEMIDIKDTYISLDSWDEDLFNYQWELENKIFQFWDWDEFEDYELDESEFEKDELWEVSV
jgi:hypothetical protein